MKKLLLSFCCLLLTILLQAQQSNYIDVFFLESAIELKEESTDKLFLFINDTLATFEETEIIFEVFPENDPTVTIDRIEYLEALLNSNDYNLNKIIFFQEKDHLYFDHENINDWNFIRIKSIGSDNNHEDLFSKNDEFALIEINTIIGEKSTSLFLEKGTVINIPPNSFVNDKGAIVTGTIHFETNEIMNIEDALLSNVTTNIGDQFLESRGMINTEAFDEDGNKLSLANGKNIQINIPGSASLQRDGFELYRGELNETTYEWFSDTAEYKTVEIKRWRKYDWKRISAEERNQMRIKRNELVASWEQKGKDSKFIKRKLKRYRKYSKNKHKRLKKKKYIYPKKRRNYDKITKRMILGNAKYKWQPDTTKRPIKFRYFQFNTNRLGMFNIDRIYKSNEPVKDLIVANTGTQEVKLYFQDEFVLLKGIKEDQQTVFKNIPINKEILLLSTKKIDDKIELGYLVSQTGQETYEITNYESYSKVDYKNKIQELAKLKR